MAGTPPAANLDLAAFATSLNDSTRALFGGLWSQPTDAAAGNNGEGNQGRDRSRDIPPT